MSDCLFCRIVAGEIPAQRVHESADSLAFRDIAPQAPTHVLVVPKRHIANASVVTVQDAALLTDLFVVAQQVAELEGLKERGHRLVFNVGEDSGNSVPHLHLHVVGGRAMGWPPFPTS